MEHAGIGLEYFWICSNFLLSSCGLCRCPNSLERRLWHWGGQVGPRWEDGAQGVKALGNAAMQREMEMERETVLRIFVKTESCFWIVIVIKSRKSFYQIGSLGSGPWLYDAPQFSAVSSDRDHLCYRIFSNVSVIYKLFMFKFSTMLQNFPKEFPVFFQKSLVHLKRCSLSALSCRPLTRRADWADLRFLSQKMLDRRFKRVHKACMKAFMTAHLRSRLCSRSQFETLRLAAVDPRFQLCLWSDSPYARPLREKGADSRDSIPLATWNFLPLPVVDWVSLWHFVDGKPPLQAKHLTGQITTKDWFAQVRRNDLVWESVKWIWLLWKNFEATKIIYFDDLLYETRWHLAIGHRPEYCWWSKNLKAFAVVVLQ